MFAWWFKGASGVRMTGKVGKSGVSGEYGVFGWVYENYIYNSTRARTYNWKYFPYTIFCIFIHGKICQNPVIARVLDK